MGSPPRTLPQETVPRQGLPRRRVPLASQTGVKAPATRGSCWQVRLPREDTVLPEGGARQLRLGLPPPWRRCERPGTGWATNTLSRVALFTASTVPAAEIPESGQAGSEFVHTGRGVRGERPALWGCGLQRGLPESGTRPAEGACHSFLPPWALA
uniref:Uncharacterized protein n=1 Tax=Molossus molossus TaxID=27622 RepID=A0A7J8FS55_MOLMO|nr:hypothetical protein HJG59_008441 [Molossus molossus]